MYGDCVHQIHPVTSGTRVSLIYDIYTTDKEASENDEDEDEEQCEEEEEYEDDEEANEEFWSNQEYGEPASSVRAVDATTKLLIVEEVSKQLHDADSLILTLQHLYPECQTSPAFLKGGDRALYELLSEQYEVQVVAATIYRSANNSDDPEELTVYGDLFAPSRVAKTLALRDEVYETPLGKRQKIEPEPKTKIVLSNNLNAQSVLDYSPYIDYTGNESQAEKTVYIVAGLQVRKRE